VSELVFQQALFGYSKGHRLLASSLKIGPESSRLLRTATDMSFGGRSESYFSSFPVPEMEKHAFVQTWPAPSWLRSGAVWSHVIFVDLVTLSRLSRVTAISALFRRPTAADDRELTSELATYEVPVTMSEVDSVISARLNLELAASVVSELYASNTPISLPVGSPRGLDDLILAIQEQQWPKLRRDFSARTRYRPSESAWSVDLELLERSSVARRPVTQEPWVAYLVRDLASPDANFRSFLNRYGAESRARRTDMPSLSNIYQELDGGAAPEDVLHKILSSFGESTQMRILKRDLLGSDLAIAPRGWSVEEPERLRLAFSAGAAVDFSELEIGKRLIWAINSRTSHSALRDLPLDQVSPGQIEILVGDIVLSASLDAAAELAIATPDIGLLVAARKPDVLRRPDVWSALDPELLLLVFKNLSIDVQDDILNHLLRHDAVEQIALVCERDRSVWWRMVLDSTKLVTSAAELVDRAATLRAVLNRFGAAAIDSTERLPSNPRESLMILLSADLSSGLWRRCPPSIWFDVLGAVHGDSVLANLPRFALDRLNAIALLTSAGGNPTIRKAGWQRTFEYLHKRLEDSAFDGEAWRVLANALPAGGAEWDRCYRLRRGAVAEIKRDSWSVPDVSKIIQAAGRGGADMQEQLRRAESKKKRKSPLRDFIDNFFS
jgi:hypothetical protein